MSNLYAVGDIHGQIHMLEALVERVPFKEDDEIVFLGDSIDRGRDSRAVVEFLIGFKREFPNTVFLQGNHEDMLLDYLTRGGNYYPGVYLMNGGDATLESYDPDGMGEVLLPPSHREFFDGLLWIHVSRGFIFVHAGLRPGVPIDRQDPMDMVWIREEFLDAEYDFGKPVVFGHTPGWEIKNKLPYYLGIDTRAVSGGCLTCVQLADGELVDCHQVFVQEVE